MNKLTERQAKLLRKELKDNYNMTLRVQKQRNYKYLGAVHANAFDQPIKMTIINATDTYRSSTENETYKNDVYKTVAHELTHVLQLRAGRYNMTQYTSRQLYDYNEIVANTVGMFLFPTRGNYIDNAGYCKRYMKNVPNELLKNLKKDVDQFLPKVKDIMEKIEVL